MLRPMKIIVGVDGSEGSKRAVDWCAAYAGLLGAEVIAIFALDFPVTTASGFGVARIPIPIPPPTDAEREQLRRTVFEDWCRPLSQSGVAFRAVVSDGSAAPAIMELAEKESADLVVTGRTGCGGFVGLVLGSTTYQLSHHLGRPLVIVP